MVLFVLVCIQVSLGVPVLLHRVSRPTHTQTHGHNQAQGLFSLKGLLTAQKFSKALRERAALKLAAKNAPERKPIVLVHEQVPIGLAQPAERFPYNLISNIIQDFLSSRLKGLHYDAPRDGILAKVLSDEVKSQVRAVCPARYKLVCIVTLGQLELEGQQGNGGLLMASRCLWDPYTDTCVSLTYQNQNMLCTIDVFAVYFE